MADITVRADMGREEEHGEPCLVTAFQAEPCAWAWALVLGNRDAVNGKVSPHQVHEHFLRARSTLIALLLCHTSASSICYKSPTCQGLLPRPVGVCQQGAGTFLQVELQGGVGWGRGAGSVAQRLSAPWECLTPISLKLQDLKVKCKDTPHRAHMLPAVSRA